MRPATWLPLLLLLLPGCRPARPAPAASAAPAGIRLVEVGRQAGIDFRLGHAGRSPLTILETAGGGCAFLDFDRDGRLDILLVGPFRVGLYRNRGDGTFQDVTRTSGLAGNRYWMGCAVGDYDGDALPDLFLTGYRCFALYRNTGRGFADVTATSGIADLDWSMSAAFADVDLDGDLDLYVTQYLRFDSTTPRLCRLGSIQSACGPEVYEPLSGRLYIQQAPGRFRPFPGWKDTGKTWGVIVSHLADTRRPAIYLANDMMPGDLWVFRNGRYRNIGPESATAFDAQGHLQGGMGVDTGDYDNDGQLDLVVTTFFTQATSLYRNDGGGLFTVTSGPSGVGGPTMPYVGFGTAFVDLDNDGWQDLIIANGHVRDNVRQFDAAQDYPQPTQVFRNREGRFSECSAAAVPPEARRIVGRGLSVGDYNLDGRQDVLICDLEGRALLLENRSAAGNWLAVRLEGAGRNRSGLGARVTVEAGGRRQIREVRTCGSVLSALDPVAHFGLGGERGPVRVTVEWPEGRRQTIPAARVNAVLTVSAAGAVREVSAPPPAPAPRPAGS